jgi:hypothetical protein
MKIKKLTDLTKARGPIYIIIGILLTIYSVNLTLILASLIMVYKITESYLGDKAPKSRTLTITTSLMFYMILLQSVIVSSWVLDHNFPLGLSVIITFMVAAIVYLRTATIRAPEPSSGRKPTNKSGMVSVIVSLLILAPYVGLNPIYSPQRSEFGDDPVFVKMQNVRIQYDRGVLYQSNASGLIYGGDTYPPGWGSANAVIIKSAYPGIQVGNQTATAYILTKIFWFFTLLVVFCRLSFALYDRMSKGKSTKISLLIMAIGLYVIGRVYIFTNVYMSGFFSFTPQLLSFLLLTPLMMQIAQKKNTSLQKSSIFMLVILAIGGCLSWFLVLPATLITVAAIIFKNVITSPQPIRFIQSYAKINYILPIFLLTTATLTQLFIMLTSHSTGAVSFVQGINIPGGVNYYGFDFYLFLTVGLLSFMSITFKSNRDYIKQTLWLAIPLALFAGLILILELITTGEGQYYFYKVVSLLLITFLPLCLAGLSLLVDLLDRSSRPLINAIAVGSLLLFYVSFLATHLL